MTASAPTGGPTAGGTSVIVHGTNFVSVSAVKFGATAATSFSVTNSTTLTATAPAQAVGTVDVTVTTACATSAVNYGDRFSYMAPPTVSGILPPSGPSAGGTLVTITGTNFNQSAGVNFGAGAATSVSLVNSTTLTAIAPAGTDTVDVTAIAAGGHRHGRCDGDHGRRHQRHQCGGLLYLHRRSGSHRPLACGR